MDPRRKELIVQSQPYGSIVLHESIDGVGDPGQFGVEVYRRKVSQVQNHGLGERCGKLLGFQLIGSSCCLPVDVFEGIAINVVAHGDKIIVMAKTAGTLIPRVLGLILVLLQQSAALGFREDQVGVLGGHVLVANEKVEWKNRAEEDSIKVVLSSLREDPLNKPGSLLLTIHEGEKDGCFAQGYADEKSGQKSSGIDQPHPDGDRSAGVDLLGKINDNVDTAEVASTKETRYSHKTQHCRSYDVHEVVGGIDR